MSSKYGEENILLEPGITKTVETNIDVGMGREDVQAKTGRSSV